jgi:hypothetical protein
VDERIIEKVSRSPCSGSDDFCFSYDRIMMLSEGYKYQQTTHTRSHQSHRLLFSFVRAGRCVYFQHFISRVTLAIRITIIVKVM